MTTTDLSAPEGTRPRQVSATRRVGALAAMQWTLIRRNRVLLFNTFTMPALPLILFFTQGAETVPPVVDMMVQLTLLVSLVFVVYYTVLSLVVSRREELVLKRLRSGTMRDGEILTGLTLTPILLGVATTTVALAVIMVSGSGFPANPALYLLALVIGSVMFAALGVWTATFTKNAEAAQITSTPVILVAMLGAFGGMLPGVFADIAPFTPLAPVLDLVVLGMDGREFGSETTLGMAGTFDAALFPGLIALAWTVFAAVLAVRFLRWEPRA